MVGRPSLYTEELASEICEAIAHSHKGLSTLCKEHHNWPNPLTIYRWLDDEDKVEFRKQYARAKDAQIEALIDETLEISDDSSNDTLTITKSNGDEVEIENKEWTNRSRLRVDTRKWIAAHLKPKKYGDKLDLTTAGDKLEFVIKRKTSDAESSDND